MSKRPAKKLEIRRPRAESVEGFVASGQASRSARTARGARIPQKGIIARAGGRVARRMTIYVDPELAKRVQIYCVEQGRDISSVAVEALERFLK